MGPEGGYGGGEVVVAGSPATVAKHKTSYTGQYLKQTLAQYRRQTTKRKKAG
jgi:excinuclease ABC subunit A